MFVMKSEMAWNIPEILHTKKGHIHISSWGGSTDDMCPQVPPHHPVSCTSLRGHFLSHERILKNDHEAFSPRTSKE